MPCLIIDVGDFDNNLQFDKFMVHALPLLDDSVRLRSFRLRSFDCYCSALWVNHAIKRKVPVLEYSEHPPAYVDDDLNLASSYLTWVVLEHVQLDDDHFRSLNNACPVLENLELLDVWTNYSVVILSSSLKHLWIVCGLFQNEFRICTPNLLTMCLDDMHINFRGSLALENLSSLMTVSISGYLCFSPKGYIENILDGLSHARNLKLVAPLYEALFERCLPTCSIFNSLKCLLLGEWCMDFDLYPLRCVLKQSPMLVELCVELGEMECKNSKERAPAFSYGEILPFRCDRLKTVKIKCREHDERFVALLQLFCKISVCIEEVDLDRRWVRVQPSCFVEGL